MIREPWKKLLIFWPVLDRSGKTRIKNVYFSLLLGAKYVDKYFEEEHAWENYSCIHDQTSQLGNPIFEATPSTVMHSKFIYYTMNIITANFV